MILALFQGSGQGNRVDKGTEWTGEQSGQGNRVDNFQAYSYKI
ncbi:MAG: hypothetical protein WC292_00170 [Clostridia bacterium]